MKQISTEDIYIGNLEERVGNYYKFLEHHRTYSSRGECGELDLLGYLAKAYCDVYEVKATDHRSGISKARSQLYRARDYFPYAHVKELFLYIGKTDRLFQLDPRSGSFNLLPRP